MYLGTDHCTVKARVQVKPLITEVKGMKKWILSNKDDLNTFANNIEQCNLNKPNNIENLTKNLTDRIKLAAEENIKRSSGVIRIKKQTPWWNAQCSKAVLERRRARRNLEKHPTQNNIETYKKKTAEAKKICNKSKEASFQEYISSLQFDTPIGEVWKKIKSIKTTYNPETYPIIHRNEFITDPVEKANIMAHHFAENSKVGKCSPPKDITTTIIKCQENYTDEEYNKKFTEEEIRYALSVQKHFSRK